MNSSPHQFLLSSILQILISNMLRRKAPRILIRYSSAAARSVADNNDLLLEILLRLPIPSLLRFKSVSKRWLSLISDPDFSFRRTIIHPPTPSGIFLSRPYPISSQLHFIDLRQRPNPPRLPFESLEFSLPKHGITIIDSSNGLLLCANEGGRYQKSHYYVLNPTTNQYTTLQIERTREILSLSLAFDPLRSSNYKVVCIRISDANNCSMIDIYSSYTGFWRRCNGAFSAPLIRWYHRGVYWNGGVHFWESRLYFDLYKEKLHELTMPQCLKEDNRRIEYFDNCCGNLDLIVIYGVEGMELNVYEMEDDHRRWFMKYKVNLHMILLSGLFPRRSSIEEMSYSMFTVVAIVDQSEKVGAEEEPYVVLQSLGKAVRVNVKSGRFEELVCVLNDGVRTKFHLGFGYIAPVLYVESLACV